MFVTAVAQSASHGAKMLNKIIRRLFYRYRFWRAGR